MARAPALSDSEALPGSSPLFVAIFASWTWRFARSYSASDTLGGRIGCDQFRMLIFQSLKRLEQAVVLRVRHGGRIFNVVLEVGAFDVAPQFFRPRGEICPHRHQENSLSASAPPA